MREAKLRTDWTAPNEKYETTARKFLDSLFAPDGLFLPIARTFIDLIAPAGAVNGLAQAVLKMTVPGVPDFFQGTEFWDFSLVDPDNRRPVDYAARQASLAAGLEPAQCLPAWRDGRIKQAVIHRILDFRRRQPDLFARGDYCPLPLKGALEQHIVAFARSLGRSVVIVVVPRLPHRLLSAGNAISFDPGNLRGSTLLLPEQLRGLQLRSLLSNGARRVEHPASDNSPGPAGRGVLR